MSYFSDVITFTLLFLSLYFEVFLLLTFMEKRAGIKEEESWELKEFPRVTVIVPCFNEQNTIEGTINSLLALNYPKENLDILVIDDGSTDDTRTIVDKFKGHSHIQIFHKQNGGKYTALNFGLQNTKTEFVGCLDADSFVHPDALKKIMVYFRDPMTMAVTPSLKIHNPNSAMRMIQNVEYNLGIFVRKISSILNAIYVTPGPFSIFRTKVFKELGEYRPAHHTEDMEMALRLQANHYKIANAHKAVVYTVGPRTLPKLYKQRVRWTHGFIQNARDYRYLIFNKKYGNLGLLVLPLAFVSFFTTIYLVFVSYYGILNFLVHQVVKIQTVGFNPVWNGFHFNWFYLNTATLSFLNMLLLGLTLLIIFTGKKMAGVKDRRNHDLIYSFALYSLIAPLWLVKAFYNTVFSKKPSWR